MHFLLWARNSSGLTVSRRKSRLPIRTTGSTGDDIVGRAGDTQNIGIQRVHLRPRFWSTKSLMRFVPRVKLR